MITHIYTLIVIRHYKNIGDSLTALIFHSRDEAEKTQGNLCNEKREYDISTAIIETIAGTPDSAINPLFTSLSFGIPISRFKASSKE